MDGSPRCRYWQISGGVWLFVFLALVTTYSIFGLGWPNTIRLAEGGRSAVGTVVRLQPHNHDGCVYSYTVGVREYTNSYEGCGAKHLLGAPLAITYLPNHPKVSVPGSAGAVFRRWLLITLLAPTGFAAATFIALRIRR
jgi:hypothetical protein